MGAIHDDPHALERHAAWERSLGVFDITAERVFDTNGFADVVGGWPDIFDFTAKDQVLDLVLDFVIELVTVRPKEFYAVIVIRIVRRGDDDPRVRAQAASDVGHARSRQRPDEQNIHAHR